MNDKKTSTNKSLQLLRDGYKKQFSEFVFESEAYADLMMELSFDFVNAELDVIQDEDLRLELAMMLMDSVNLSAY